MATLYIFEGIDEKKQLNTAFRYAKAGLEVDVHYHHAWEKITDNAPSTRIPCNVKCTHWGKEEDDEDPAPTRIL